ncbi:MAG: AMP-binding protein, partial [Pyramidobacter sp.]|nr:AMP-binding protein [Pyramidobacter sp.]
MTEKVRLEKLIAEKWSFSEPVLWYDGEWWTAQKLFDLAEEDRRILEAAGFGEGCRLATLLPNCPAFHALCIACWQLGGAVAPLNALAGAQAVGATVQHSMPALIGASAALKKHEKDFEPLGVPLAFVDDRGALPDIDAVAAAPLSSPDMAFLFYTSGTTGTPKGVPLTHENIYRGITEAIELAIPGFGDETVLNVLPNFHTLGCIVSGTMPLFMGMRQAIRASFMPVEGTLRAIDEAGVTLMITVPTLLHFLCGAAMKSGWKPQRLTRVVSGGDRLLPVLRDRVAQYLGARVIEGYGLTECSPVLAVQTPEGSPEGSVGPLLPSIQYCLKDIDGSLLSGDEGVLWVKGPSVASEYFNAPEITREKFADGYFNTGDMTRVDEHRNVFIMERVSDLIIVGGFNVYPQEVETVLNANPKVRESAAVGVSRSVTGQIVRAFVILKEGVTCSSSELAEWCRERLPHYKVPR